MGHCKYYPRIPSYPSYIQRKTLLLHFLSPRQSRMNREARTLMFVSSTGLDVYVTFVI